MLFDGLKKGKSMSKVLRERKIERKKLRGKNLNKIKSVKRNEKCRGDGGKKNVWIRK